MSTPDFVRALVVALLSVPFVLSPWMAGAASFTPLGFLHDWDPTSTAEEVSADGSTVVGSANLTFGPEAFVWDSVNGMRAIGGLADGSTASTSEGVSGNGSIVVGNSTLFGDLQPYVWDDANGPLRLGSSAGELTNARVRALSSDGTTVAGLIPTSRGSDPFVWDAVNGRRGLTGVPADIESYSISGLSADGSIVVGEVDNFLGLRAFIWDASNGMYILPDRNPISGNNVEVAWDVSADGRTLVGYYARSPSGSREAFVWDAVNGSRSLGFLPGGYTQSEANAVSGDGSIVVGRSLSTNGSDAFVWDANYGMRELSVLLSTLGVDLSGWRLVSATSISDDGKTIVGNGINPSGRREAWIAVIPEPSTAVSIFVGLLGLSLRRPSVTAVDTHR